MDVDEVLETFQSTKDFRGHAVFGINVNGSIIEMMALKDVKAILEKN